MKTIAIFLQLVLFSFVVVMGFAAIANALLVMSWLWSVLG